MKAIGNTRQFVICNPFSFNKSIGRGAVGGRRVMFLFYVTLHAAIPFFGCADATQNIYFEFRPWQLLYLARLLRLYWTTFNNHHVLRTNKRK
jgi:hypothetical protein